MSSETKYLNSSYQDFFEKSLSKSDPDLFKAINDELIRQQNHIELIASENIVSQAVDITMVVNMSMLQNSWL